MKRNVKTAGRVYDSFEPDEEFAKRSMLIYRGLQAQMIPMGVINVEMRVLSDESDSGTKHVRNQIVRSHNPCSNGYAHEQGA